MIKKRKRDYSVHLSAAGYNLSPSDMSTVLKLFIFLSSSRDTFLNSFKTFSNSRGCLTGTELACSFVTFFCLAIQHLSTEAAFNSLIFAINSFFIILTTNLISRNVFKVNTIPLNVITLPSLFLHLLIQKTADNAIRQALASDL